MPHGATFLSVTVYKELGSRAKKPWDAITIEIVGKFQILVKLNSMNTNTSVSIARILWLNENKQHEER